MSYSFVDLGWIQTDIDDVNSNADGFALRGSIGFAGWFKVDASSGGDSTALAVGGRYYFTRNFAVGAEYQQSDDSSTILAGARYSF
jgi:hypothetical protein